MKIILKFLKVCLIFCVFFLVTVFSVSADTSSNIKMIEEYISQSLELRLERIDVYEFGLKEADIFNILDRVMKTNPDFYYVGNSFYYTVDDFGIVEEISPRYTYTSSEVKNIKAYCDGELEKILFVIEDDMTELQKALYLHEYMCENFEYDKSLGNYNMYDLLLTGRGTCQAFMLTYMELMNRVGIESDYAYSGEIMHIWNLVKLDGEWYHVDITWDNLSGGVSHKNFLLSDKEILENGHRGFVNANGVECISERYREIPIRDIPYKYAPHKDGFLYVDNITRSVYFDKLDGSEKAFLYRIDELWAKGEGRYYANSFSEVVKAGNKVYFNTKNKIMAIDDELCVSVAMELDFEVYGVFLDGSGLGCRLDRYGDNGRNIELEKSFDADGDGELTVLDMAALSAYIARGSGFVYKYDVDANGDYRLDRADLKALEARLICFACD